MEKKYVETISGINVANGIVKLYFINEDDQNKADGKEPQDPEADKKVLMKHDHTIIMPVSGFMYMASVMQNLLQNEEMQEQIKKYIEAGLLPKMNDGQEK
jgi:hypothetical protein